MSGSDGEQVMRSGLWPTLGDSAVLEKLIRLFADRRVDDVFRRPDAPFYWLAARLWLVITFDRIATEIPTSVKKYSVWLLDIATDEEPPHFLIRSVAKSALLKLVGGGHVQLDAQQSQSLQLVNSSTYARKKRKKGIRRVFHKYQYKARENRRFTFNTTDTLPNWYSDVISGFTDVDAEEFLDLSLSVGLSTNGVFATIRGSGTQSHAAIDDFEVVPILQ